LRLAILADIHGNIFALQAVAAKLEQLQPDAVIVNGDIINAIPFSDQVVDFLRGTDWIVVRGNHEFYYLDYASGRAPADRDDAERWGQLHWLMTHLRPDQGNYLAALPDDLTLFFPETAPIRIAHGTPGNNRQGFSNTMPAEDIAAALRDIPQQTFINAHTHVQIDRIITERDQGQEAVGDPAYFLEEQPQESRVWHVINPGSAGQPLNGDTRAQFAIIESVSPDTVPGGWRVSHYRIPYDRRPALEGYHTTGMLEAGGVISELFYWELVTAEREIPFFFLWRRANLPPDDLSFRQAFEAYKQATGREEYVRARDPLRTRSR
jgi:predicted phosphodiesterase